MSKKSQNRDPAPLAIVGGAICPKCGKSMQRFEHSRQWRPREGHYHFKYWDICRPCGHTQHYEAAKVEPEWKGKGPLTGSDIKILKFARTHGF